MTANDTTAQAPAYELPTGYSVKYESKGYHLLAAGDDAPEGAAAYLVACPVHGATTPAETVAKGHNLGRKADRATWCDGCKALAADAPAPAAPGTVQVPVNLTITVLAEKWAPAQDTAALVAAIVAQTGVDEATAAQLAQGVVTKAVDVKAQVRDWVLAQVQGLDRLKEAGATVALRGVPATTPEAPAAPAPEDAKGNGKAKK